ncbi:MAG: DUF1800 family protein [Acidobacteria bacterium]|nr:DUF1800 family protein [Acidobacteriota bacterium]
MNQDDAVRGRSRKSPAPHPEGRTRPSAGAVTGAMALAAVVALSGAPLAAQGTSFYTVTPCRLVDTRGPAGPFGAPALAAGAVRAVDAAGQCGISTRAVAVSANVTVVGPPGAGFLVFGPAGVALPPTSTLNFSAGQVRANNQMVQLGVAGAFAVGATIPPGNVDVIVDVNGYFANAALEGSTTAPPAFNPPPGSYGGQVQVQMFSSTPGAHIYYTTDGSTPSSSHGTLYSGAVTLTATTTLEAIATAAGLADSPVTTGQYNVAATATLFLAQMVPQGSSLSLGFGSASLLLAADRATAVLHYTYSNLTGPIVAQHIHGPGGPILFDIDTSVPDSTGGRLWTIVPAGGFTVPQILAALLAGQCYVNLHTAMYPSGEIKGFLNVATGNQTFVPPPPPPALPPPPATQSDAARFLMQATYGPTSPADVAVITGEPTGFGPWLTNQFGQPLISHLAYIDAARAAGEDISSNQVMESFWRQAVTGRDQLRQRVALALSEIMVISDQNSNVDPEGMARYLDVLEGDALGNFRQLLEDVTLDPTMGVYLNMLQNDQGDPANGINPNENYAREVNQLFSIGLYKLNPDGTLILDSTGLPIPTYDQNVVKGFAQVFTGWTWAGGDHSDPNNFYNYNPNWRQPMEAWPEHHSPGAKVLLDGATLPAGQTPQQDLDAALDLIFHHPNVGPFICRQLIQRLVTSNPSPAYVYRCGQAFANDGQGVRGDMQAVVSAILLDYEARATTFLAGPGYGKLREPIVRLGQLLRATNAVPPPDNKWRIWDTSDAGYGLDENPLRAATVFNFFEPTYVQPGAIAQAGLVAPEFKITTDTTVFGAADYLHDVIYYGAAFDPYTIVPNYSGLVGLADSNLLDYFNLVMMANGMSAPMRSILATALADPNFSDPNDATTRVKNLLYLIELAPEYVVQR